MSTTKTVHSGGVPAVFSSVGFEIFRVFLKDEATGAAKNEAVFDAASFERHLPEYLERNARGRESLIVDPESVNRFIQVDDCTPEVLRQLAPASFLQVETSDGNGQAWLALAGVFDDISFAALRARLFRQLKPTGANPGANGSLRWPGSLNCKPARRRLDGSYPTVRVLNSQPGKFTTAAELEQLGALAPPVSPSPVRAERRPAGRAARPGGWPSYQIELENADGDRSRADYLYALRCMRWGWSEDETAAQLHTVSQKAQEKPKGQRESYIKTTVRKAAGVIAGRA